MAGRKTRTKLKFQAEKAMADIDRSLGHLDYLHELADGQHPFVNEYMPVMVALMDAMQKVLKRFRENL